jgi:hypothetical protein
MAKKSKAKARKRVATKDLEPKDVKDVKGGKGSFSSFVITKPLDKPSPSL